LGKVLLPFLSEEERKKILEQKELTRLTDNTIINRNILEKELSKIQEQGFALDQ